MRNREQGSKLLRCGKRSLALVAVCAAAALGGAAMTHATIPAADGKVWTCYANNDALRVFDEETGETCRGTELALLGASAKAADADRLDGVDSTGFYAAGSKVRDSDTLDGIDSSGFVQGAGNVYQNVLRPTAYANYRVVDVPGFGSLLGGCDPDGRSFFDFHNTSGETLDAIVDAGGSNPTHSTIANGENPYIGDAFTTTTEAMTVQLSRSARIATLIVSAHGVPTGTPAVNCFINALAITN